MNKLLIGAALLAASGTAAAFGSPNLYDALQPYRHQKPYQACHQFAKLGGRILHDRYMGKTKFQAFDWVKKHPKQVPKPTGDFLVAVAYPFPLKHTRALMKLQIQGFKHQLHTRCMGWLGPR